MTVWSLVLQSHSYSLADWLAVEEIVEYKTARGSSRYRNFQFHSWEWWKQQKIPTAITIPNIPTTRQTCFRYPSRKFLVNLDLRFFVDSASSVGFLSVNATVEILPSRRRREWKKLFRGWNGKLFMTIMRALLLVVDDCYPIATTRSHVASIWVEVGCLCCCFLLSRNVSYCEWYW